MAEEPQLHLDRLQAAAEFESTSTFRTSQSCDEETSSPEGSEKEDWTSTGKKGDVEQGENAPLQSGKRKTKSLHFLGWTIVNTLATIAIVGMQSRL